MAPFQFYTHIKHLGQFEATAYGPPWDAMNGSGVTSTGIHLTGTEQIVAADPSVLPMGSIIVISPVPPGKKNGFMVGDVGGAIKGKHIDVLLPNRSLQNSWGKRSVDVQLVGSYPNGDTKDYQAFITGKPIPNAHNAAGSIFPSVPNPIPDVKAAIEDLAKVIGFIFSTQFLYIVGGIPLLLIGMYMIYKSQGGSLPKHIPIPV